MDRGLRAFNALRSPEAALSACCAAPGWAATVASGRPYADRDAVRAAGAAALASASWADVAAALADHPRIGAVPRGDDRRSAWSRSEQRAAAGGTAELAAANEAYERRFGHVFLLCAAGRTRDEVLAALRDRLDNDPATERRVVRAELAAIAALRLDRLLDELGAELEGERR